MEQGIKNNTVNNKCSRCGECCGLFVPFTDKEIEEIKQYVKEHNITQENRITDKGFEARCCFYDVKNHCCKIYPVRPYVCKDFSCGNKYWEQKRDTYELSTPYNSSLRDDKIIATFDDKIYNDYEPLIRILATLSDNDPIKFKMLLKEFHRTDILNIIVCKDENDNTINF